jgi:hypothetical protein
MSRAGVPLSLTGPRRLTIRVGEILDQTEFVDITTL